MDCDTTGIEPDIALVSTNCSRVAACSRSSTRRSNRRCTTWATTRQIEGIIQHIDKYDTIEDVLGEDGTTISSGLKPEDLPCLTAPSSPTAARARCTIADTSA